MTEKDRLLRSDDGSKARASLLSFPPHLLSQRQQYEERGIFVYREPPGWWEFFESHRDPVRAQERVRILTAKGDAVALVKRDVVMSPWSIVSVVEAAEPESVQFCGVARLWDREFPCVLAAGHDGFCDFGPKYEAARDGS